jgi:hypothetical protein
MARIVTQSAAAFKKIRLGEQQRRQALLNTFAGADGSGGSDSD